MIYSKEYQSMTFQSFQCLFTYGVNRTATRKWFIINDITHHRKMRNIILDLNE